MNTAIPGFTYQRTSVGDVTLNVAVGGAGAPVVLLHGFPQTHLAWRHVAVDLATDHFVVCPDLRGYGDSDKPEDDADHTTYSKRTMAVDLVQLMRALGHDRFAVVGHDRGAGVAFRAGLDHPEQVSHVAVLGVIPSADLWPVMTGPVGVHLFHIYLMAAPAPIPERIIGADPDGYFGHFLDVWTSGPGAIPPDVRAAYLAAARTPAAIRAICADYRAGAFVDPGYDEVDRANGRQLRMPVLAVMPNGGGSVLPFDPEAVWKAWAPDLRTATLPGRHLLPEDCPAELTAALRAFLP